MGEKKLYVSEASGVNPIRVDDLDAARRLKAQWDDEWPEFAPHRIQRRVTTYEDVPEPEPLPEDLPTEVLMCKVGGQWMRVLDAASGYRTYQGRVSEWVEVLP